MEKKEIKLSENLFSTKENIVLAAISEIKKNGSSTFLKPLLILIQKTKNLAIKNEAKSIFLNIKEENAAGFIVSAIKNKEYAESKKFLISACWQNGLDYSNFLRDFVSFFINEEFEIAFDAFTVIENLPSLPDKKIVEREIANLKSCSSAIDENKKNLLVELVNILSK